MCLPYIPRVIQNDWQHVNFSTDKGSDMVTEDHVYQYLLGVNTNRDYDQGHGTHRGGTKTLKDAGVWEHEVVHAHSIVSRMMDCEKRMGGGFGCVGRGCRR